MNYLDFFQVVSTSKLTIDIFNSKTIFFETLIRDSIHAKLKQTLVAVYIRDFYLWN